MNTQFKPGIGYHPIFVSKDEAQCIRDGLLSHISMPKSAKYDENSFGRVGYMVELVELRPIPYTDNKGYMAGSDGLVYTSMPKGGRRSKQQSVPWYQLKGWKGNNDYWSVLLVYNGERKSLSLHKCICAAFHGLNTEKDIQVRHLDGNAINNRPENLKWGTRYENFEDRKAHGTILYGEHSNLSRFTDLERSHIKWAVENGLCSQKQVARVLNVGFNTINAICNFSPAIGTLEVQPPQQIRAFITRVVAGDEEYTIYFDYLTSF